MSNLANVLNLIKNDLYKEKKDNICLDFFYKSILHYAISLEIASANQNTKSMTFVNICVMIPKKIGSRSSIKSVLDNGVLEGFFIKTIDPNDKRSKSFKLSEEYSLMITEWYLSRKVNYGG